jgi:hypothetical protein
MNFFNFGKHKPAAIGREITLPEAVRQGLVTFQLRGTGEGVTSSVALTVIKLTDEPLTILVPRGTEFVPFQRG